MMTILRTSDCERLQPPAANYLELAHGESPRAMTGQQRSQAGSQPSSISAFASIAVSFRLPDYTSPEMNLRQVFHFLRLSNMTFWVREVRSGEMCGDLSRPQLWAERKI